MNFQKSIWLIHTKPLPLELFRKKNELSSGGGEMADAPL
jgi:hypothetical protein